MSEMGTGTGIVVRRSVTVPLAADAAFELFTTGIGSWWPTDTHSVDGAEAVARMDARLGGHIDEVAGNHAVRWGTITAWDPPRGFTTSWHPGYEEALATRLRVRFVGEGPSRTRVELEHDGWEVHGPAAEEKATDYLSGWVPVLARFVERAAA